MLTENEVDQLLEIPEVRRTVEKLCDQFKEEEREFNNLNLHDFLSGMLMTPSVALAMVDGATSLFEELSLNKKARRFSKGGFFLQQDPVVKMVIYVKSRLHRWEDKILEELRKILQVVVPEISNGLSSNSAVRDQVTFLEVMRSSYILIKFLETFFLPEGEEITNKRHITAMEHQKVRDIGSQLGLSGLDSFQNFIKTFEVK